MIAVFKKKKNHKGGSLVQLSWCPFIRGSTARVLAVSLALPPPPPTLSVPLPSEMQLFAGQGEPLPATDPTGPQSDLKKI